MHKRGQNVLLKKNEEATEIDVTRCELGIAIGLIHKRGQNVLFSKIPCSKDI